MHPNGLKSQTAAHLGDFKKAGVIFTFKNAVSTPGRILTQQSATVKAVCQVLPARWIALKQQPAVSC